MAKLPAGRGKPILYLDYDGVLHPENVVRTRRRGPVLSGYPGHALFEHVEALHHALEPYPEVLIVLSTTWVQVQRYSRARKHLGPLRPRVIGATYHSAMPKDLFQDMSRGLQVWADVRRRQPGAWLALDDDAHDWPAWARNNLVHTDDEFGVAHPAVWAEFHSKLEQAVLAVRSANQVPA
ncbi:HAD domain-containing protein [Achromobacter xylosoxidans]